MKLLFVTHEMDNGGVSRLLGSIQKALTKANISNKILTLFGLGEMFDKSTCDTLARGVIKIQKLRKHSRFLKLIYLVQSPIIVTKFLKYIENYKPDIIVTNMWGSDIISLLTREEGYQKIVSIQHNVVKINPFLRVLKIMALKHVDYVIAISQAVEQFLIDYFKVPESKIKVIYNGIETNKFLDCIKNNTSKDLVFGTIARLDKIKGHIYILESLNLLKVRFNAQIYIRRRWSRKS
jgi:glycosyltransferase involved in cell wall biosynthesis